MDRNSKPMSVVAELLGKMSKVQSRDKFAELLDVTFSDEFADEVQPVHIDAYLARLSELIRQSDAGLRSSAAGEAPQPTWRWFGEVLLRAAQPAE